jgi:hypothetical protein
MAYSINNTTGTLLVTLADGTINTTTTDIALFGKGYAGFGERLNENLVKMLENFANSSAPANKQKGQLWYDTLDNQIKVWNGNKFKPVGSSTNSGTSPTNANTGDFWFDTNNSQLYVYDGTAWTLIGPTTVAGSGVTQVSSETIEDNVGVNKSVLKLITNDVIVGIVSAEEFTPGTAISGFATIYKGITLSTSISGNKFKGTASDSDTLGGIAAANYLRSNIADSTSGRLTIATDDGLRIGSGNDVTMSLTDDNFTIAQVTENKDTIFTVNYAGSTTTLMTLDGSTGRLELPRCGDVRVLGNLTVDGTTTTLNTSNLTVEDNLIELNRNVSSASGMPNYTGLKVNRGSTSSATEQDLYWVWDETFADDGTTIYGNAGGAWTAFKSGGGDDELSAPTLVDIRANIVHATSTSAQYADLAERYATDTPLEVGDVVILGGSEEITRCTKELDDAVFGVVSEKPAFLMNKDAGNDDSHPMIALKGRVRVKITGTGSAGDRIVSAGNGTARVAALEECTAFNTLGRLLKAKYTQQTELHECVIGVK